MMDDIRRREAVHAAMVLFWTHGADAASYGDIVVATGLSRKALYAVWPDKDALVYEALQHYRDSVLWELMRPLKIGGRAGIEGFWDQLEAEIKAAPSWAGCFLLRSASGPLRMDPFVSAAYDEYAGKMRAEFSACVEEGQSEGSLAANLVPQMVGWQALALNNLLSSMGARAGYTREVDEVFAVARAACGLMD